MVIRMMIITYYPDDLPSPEEDFLPLCYPEGRIITMTKYQRSYHFGNTHKESKVKFI
jgi:hypothetical protein